MYQKIHKKLYHIERIDETPYSKKVFDREKKLKTYQKLRVEGCNQKVILETLEISKATYYR